MRWQTGVGIGTFIVFLSLIAVFIGYIGSLGIRIRPPDNRTILSLDVSDVNNLVVDSNVLFRGVPVGKVTQIETSPANATVHFYVNGQYEIPVDSDVRLENLSALGESYIELEPRKSGAPFFSNGQKIAPDPSNLPPSISELGTSVVRVLNQMDPQQLSRVVGEADAALPDPNSVLPNLARTSFLLRNTTADFKGKGRELLDNFQVLLQNASFVGPALANTTTPVRDMGPDFPPIWKDGWMIVNSGKPSDFFNLSLLIQRIQKLLDDRSIDLKVLGIATSENLKLIANALKNLDSSQLLDSLLATVPEDGAINLHVPVSQR